MTNVTDGCPATPYNLILVISGYAPIRKVLTATLALAILLWVEAGLALVAGDRVMACHAMMHAAGGTMAASDNAGMADLDAMPCCPDGPGKTPAIAVNHPPCCSVSNDAERPLAFMVSSERPTPHPLDTAVRTAGNFVPGPEHNFGELRTADSPRFVRPILELKTDLRI